MRFHHLGVAALHSTMIVTVPDQLAGPGLSGSDASARTLRSGRIDLGTSARVELVPHPVPIIHEDTGICPRPYKE